MVWFLVAALLALWAGGLILDAGGVIHALLVLAGGGRGGQPAPGRQAACPIGRGGGLQVHLARAGLPAGLEWRELGAGGWISASSGPGRTVPWRYGPLSAPARCASSAL
jgi:hypothetical protein